jgi:hypothetical protein
MFWPSRLPAAYGLREVADTIATTQHRLRIAKYIVGKTEAGAEVAITGLLTRPSVNTPPLRRK